MNISSRFFTTW